MKSSTKKVIIIGATGVALIVAGAVPALAARGGMMSQMGTAISNWHGSQSGSEGKQNGKRRGRVTSGTITAISGTTLTLQPFPMHHASTTPATVQVNTTATTTVLLDGKASTLAALAIGERAMISGIANTDGSITATRVFVRTASSTMMGGRGRGPSDVDNDGD